MSPQHLVLLMLVVASLAWLPRASAQKRVAVLSDIHMCDEIRTCWYQKKIHEPILIAILNKIIAEKDTISELVLAGDVFDTWTYPFNVRPPTIAKILAAHPNIFGPNGKLGQVLDALNGQVSYMNGNHDLQVTAADLASIVSPTGKKIKFRQNNYSPGGNKRLIISHGHEFCLFNKPDLTTSFAPLPVGHFVTRMISEYWFRRMKPNVTVADLPNQGNPNGADYGNIISNAIDAKDFSLAKALIDGVVGKLFLPFEPNIVNSLISMADGSTTTLNAVKAKFSNLFTREIAANGGNAVGLLLATKSAVADYNGAFLGWFAQRMAFQRGAEMVLFGHTHTPIRGLEKSFIDYLNTGFVCASDPDLKSSKAKVSFMTVLVPASASSPLTPSLLELSRDKKGLLSFKNLKADTTTITVGAALDYSTYAEIENTQNTGLTLSGTLASRGYFAHLPTTIPPNSKAVVWMQDYLGVFGSGGIVTYRDNAKRDIVFNFECPVIVTNSISGGSSFTARSNNPDGSFSTLVPKTGYPLFIKYKVNSGLIQGTFTASKAGQNSFATSAGGLQPSQKASINGKLDLSGIVQANSGGRVFSIKLDKLKPGNIYTYRLTINARGPRGAFSGSMYLYFTDQSGDRYLKTVFSSKRSDYTLDYNSEAPAIVQIRWSNTLLL